MSFRAALCGVLLSAALVAQTPLYTYRGAQANDFAGEGLAVVGDLDLDGTDDFIYGESGFDGVAGVNCGRVTAISGADGTVIYRTEGPTPNEWMGAALARLDDVDGDGISEWLAGSPYGGPNGANSGVVHVVDGATGGIFRTHLGAGDTTGDGFGDYLGYSVAGCGDVDGDATPDYIVGAPGDYFEGFICGLVQQGGYFEVRSGATGTVIHTVLGQPGCFNAGTSCAGLGDLTGDGRAEFLFGFPESTGSNGRIEVRNGFDGTILRLHSGISVGSFLGTWVSEIGDLDGDGIPDYAGGADNFSAAMQAFGPGYVRAYSGATGTFIRQFSGMFNGDSFGRGFGDAGDWSGDGVDDLYVAAPYDPTAGGNAGRISIIDGATGASLFQVLGEAPGEFIGFGGRSRVIQDLDGDGKVEILAASWANDRNGINSGVVTIHASQSRNHWVSQSLISIATPGRVEFEVQGPASGIYVALGSLTGSSPATVFGPYSIPLVNDAWFNLTFDPATSPFSEPVGFLNLQGWWRAYLDIPPGLPPFLAGLMHWSAAVTVHPLTFAIATTNSATFTLAP